MDRKIGSLNDKGVGSADRFEIRLPQGQQFECIAFLLIGFQDQGFLPDKGLDELQILLSAAGELDIMRSTDK